MPRTRRVYPSDLGGLIREADALMYEVESAGKNNVRVRAFELPNAGR